jgi:WD40 repeat protein
MSAIEVAIGPGPAGYRVDVVRSPAGEASATVDLDAEGLLARRQELQHAILVSSVPTRRLLDENEQAVREVGQALFKALLGTGEVAGRYRAAERDEDLRLVLRIDDPVLAGLPWEAMYDDGIGTYVCRRHQLVRHVGVPAAAAPLAVAPPLRVLGIVSSPRGLSPLDVEKEKDQLTRALAGNGSVQLTWAPSATWADLQDVLLGGTWHVVHFVGHGDFDRDRDEGVLALTGEDGRKDLVEASRFVDLLRQAQPVPRLVVLNSCSGAESGITDLFSGTAAALVRGGVTAVAAMQYEITDQAAIAFARGFYGAITRGRGVDEAISSGRVAILGLSGKTLEWVTPVLYLRGHDSHLVNVPTPGPAPVPEHLVRTLTGHNGQIWGVAFSQDGALLATASADSTARLWQTATGTYVRSLAGHTDEVNGVAFSPDGTLLATVSDDKTVRLWQAATGTLLSTLTGHTSRVWGVAFSPDGILLATASDDKTARLWQVASGTHVRTLKGHNGPVVHVAFSPDGILLATASDDKTARLWQVASGTHVRTLNGHTGGLGGVTFSPDGALLATASNDKTARLWETATGANVRALNGHTNEVWGVAFSPDGTFLATASRDQTVRLWRTATRMHVRTLNGHTGPVSSVAFSPDGLLLASASHDRTVRLWG